MQITFDYLIEDNLFSHIIVYIIIALE